MGAEVQIDRVPAADRDASGTSQLIADEHYIARLNLLQNLIRTHRISKKKYITKIVDYALSKLSSENSAVRINAYLTLSEVYEIKGHKIWPYMVGARPY